MNQVQARHWHAASLRIFFCASAPMSSAWHLKSEKYLAAKRMWLQNEAFIAVVTECQIPQNMKGLPARHWQAGPVSMNDQTRPGRNDSYEYTGSMQKKISTSLWLRYGSRNDMHCSHDTSSASVCFLLFFCSTLMQCHWAWFFAAMYQLISHNHSCWASGTQPKASSNAVCLRDGVTIAT